MKIIVDEVKCIGCGMCEAVSAGVLIMGDNAKAKFNTDMDINDPNVVEAGKMATMACPQGAISVTE